MAEQNNDQEKTEEPTPKKLEKAKEEGNVSKSQELSSAFMLTISALIIYFLGEYILTNMVALYEKFYQVNGRDLNNLNNAAAYLGEAFAFGLYILAPILLVMGVASVLISLVQTGVIFSTKVLAFKGNRINPLEGIKRVVSVKGLVELLKGVIKITVIGVIIYYTLRSEVELMLGLMLLPLPVVIAKAGYFVMLLVTRILFALLVISIADMIYQRYEHRKNLRMTKQEVKDEYKQMEGDPQVKSQRKKQMNLLSRRRRLDHAVLTSDVVVTNPTHYAVALKYDPDHDEAPIIQAKGMRKRALKIREFAKEYDIPILENPPVARALYASAEEEEMVPAELYEAVAEILAYVYKLKQQKSAA